MKKSRTKQIICWKISTQLNRDVKEMVLQTFVRMNVACWEILRKSIIKKKFLYIESEKDIEIPGTHNDKSDLGELETRMT